MIAFFSGFPIKPDIELVLTVIPVIPNIIVAVTIVPIAVVHN